MHYGVAAIEDLIENRSVRELLGRTPALLAFAIERDRNHKLPGYLRAPRLRHASVFARIRWLR